MRQRRQAETGISWHASPGRGRRRKGGRMRSRGRRPAGAGARRAPYATVVALMSLVPLRKQLVMEQEARWPKP